MDRLPFDASVDAYRRQAKELLAGQRAGDLDGLRSAIEADPELVHRRSTRVTHFDPPAHRAMLLHYVAPNGVEGYQAALAEALLDFGASIEEPSLTPMDPQQACGIGLLQVDKNPPAEIVSDLWTDHRILATPIITEGEYEGVRVTPNIFTTLQEIDQFCEYVEEKVRKAA